MTWRPLGLCIAVLVAIAHPAVAQSKGESGPQLFGGIAVGHQFRGFDAAGSNSPDGGVSVLLKLSPHLGIEIEALRSFKGIQTEGSVSVDSVVGGNASYFFRSSKAQPYISGGYGVLRSTLVTNLLTVGGRAVITPQLNKRRETTGAGNVGFGIIVPVTAHVSVRPEFRFYGSSNAGLYRTGLAAGYHW
jgi:hypothetical protein